MDFHEYHTQYQICSRSCETAETQEKRDRAIALTKDGVETFFQRARERILRNYENGIASLAEARATMFTSYAEEAWYRANRRYYKIWPDYVEMLAQTQMNVPFRLLRLPSRAFAVRFPKGQELLVQGWQIHSLLFAELRTEEMREHFERYRSYTPDRLLLLRIGFEPLQAGRIFYESVLTLTAENADTLVEDYMRHEQWTDSFGDTDTSRLTTDQNAAMAVASTAVVTCYRIAIAVCFLATGGDRVIDPDVLNKDFRAYLDAVNKEDRNGVNAFRTRAATARNGQQGFTLGRREAVLGERAYDVDTRATADAAGSPLKYRHVRNAHFHTYWTGPGRTKETPKFIRMLIIRPDLPPDPRVKGYRTPRTKEELED